MNRGPAMMNCYLKRKAVVAYIMGLRRRERCVLDSARLIKELGSERNLSILPGKCLRLRGRVDCSECRGACALGLPFRSPDVILDEAAEEECSACGACASSCPTGAISLTGETISDRLRQYSESLAGANRIELACARARPHGEAVEVRCLRGLTPAELIHLWALGAGTIAVTTADCPSCPDGSGHENDVASLAVAARRIAAVLRRTELSVSVASVAPAVPGGPQSRSVDRRGFFTEVLRKGGRTFAAAAPLQRLDDEVPEHEQGAARPDWRRSLLVRALASLLRPGEAAPDDSLGFRNGPLSTAIPAFSAEKCIACGDCAAFCPTGAIRATTRGGGWALSFSASRCVGCGLCVTLCRGSAIQLSDEGIRGALKRSATVLRRPVVACEKCGSLFPGEAGAELCPNCSKSSSRFAGFY